MSNIPESTAILKAWRPARIVCIAHLWFVVMLLIGCAGSKEHLLSIPDGVETSTIQATTKRDGLLVWTRTNVIAVDEKFVEFSAWTGYPEEVLSPAGQRTVVVELTFHRSLGAPLLLGQAKLNVNLLAGKSYKLMGRVEGLRAFVWLEDVAGNRVGEEESMELASSGTVSAPIVIPQPTRAR